MDEVTSAPVVLNMLDNLGDGARALNLILYGHLISYDPFRHRAMHAKWRLLELLPRRHSSSQHDTKRIRDFGSGYLIC